MVQDLNEEDNDRSLDFCLISNANMHYIVFLSDGRTFMLNGSKFDNCIDTDSGKIKCLEDYFK